VFIVSANTVKVIQFYRPKSKRPNQQYQSTERKDATKVNPEKANNRKNSNTINAHIYKKIEKFPSLQ